jgi:hypothetical protein
LENRSSGVDGVNFRYFVIHSDRRRNEPKGLFAVNAGGAPLYNVSYDHVARRWVYNPHVVEYLSGENADEAEEVDRAGAEETARSLRLLPVPSEVELERIVDVSTTGGGPGSS